MGISVNVVDRSRADSRRQKMEDQRRQVEQTAASKFALINHLLENDDGKPRDVFSMLPAEERAAIFPDASAATYENGVLTLDMPGESPEAGFQKQSIDLKPYAEILRARVSQSGSRRGRGLDSADTTSKNRELETTTRQLGVLKTIAKHPERYEGKSISELPSEWASAFAQYPDAKIENGNLTYTEGKDKSGKPMTKSVDIKDMVDWLSEQRAAYWKPDIADNQRDAPPQADIQIIDGNPYYLEYDERGAPVMRPVPIEASGLDSAGGGGQPQGGNKFMRGISALKNVWFPPAEAEGPPQAVPPEPAKQPQAAGIDSAEAQFGDSEPGVASEPDAETGLNAAPKTTNMDASRRRGADKILPQNYTLSDEAAGRYSTVKELLEAVKSTASYKPGTPDREILEKLAAKGLLIPQ